MSHFQLARRYASPAFTRIALGCALCCAAASAAWPAPAGEEDAAAPVRAEASEKKGDLETLRGRIRSLREKMTETEGQRAEETVRIKEVERDISATQRELRALSEQKTRLRAALKELDPQARDLARRLEDFAARLESLAYHRYLRGQPDPLRLLLAGDHPNQMARDLYYLGAIGQARRQLASETQTLLEEKRALSDGIRERAQELSAVEARQKEQQARLVVQRERRQEALARISSEISRQRREIGQLQRDERELARLIARLEETIAEQAARRENAAEPAGRSAPEALPGGHFAALMGRLRLPVRGALTNRFGGARQEGSTWKGLFIRAPQGAEVRTIAAGRVVFADWLRGFGNLLIVDHGDGYLSVYGYNDALLKETGDEVRGGDSIAIAGNSGGGPESGLYFELRHQGQPIDPSKWLGL
ncbi:MAG: peptidoglycan DD-metalloendopeptidase family protein [Candidatus Accumulibacter sp.]|jgi:septal ring factor EnvC (AmiA/AmiB activator)|nr:peptidoglycan DD-metalloendopeptidase family protein [Accumulibacter sp.]